MMKNLKDALSNSVHDEEEAVEDRFSKAEAYFQGQDNESSKAQAGPPHEKVIRDGFTMPASDYALITEVRDRSLRAGISLTKSEVLRAGLHALSTMAEDELSEVAQGLQRVKTGRPGSLG